MVRNAVAVIVDLDARREMLLDVMLGDVESWRTSHPFKYQHLLLLLLLLLHHLLHLLRPQHPD